MHGAIMQVPKGCIRFCYRVFGKFAVRRYEIIGACNKRILIRTQDGDEWVTKGDNLYATQKEANAALARIESYRSHV